MNDKQQKRFERLQRAASFGAARAADFPPASKGGQVLARLTVFVSEIERFETERAAKTRGGRQATGSKAEARETLRTQLAAIADTAETIGFDHPEVRGAFPLASGKMSDSKLLTTARDFATAALAHKARFVEYDMPADFLDTLGAGIAAFEQSAGRQTAEAGARVTATAAVEEALGRGEQELERLDTAVRNVLRADAAALAAWDGARRLERAPARKQGMDAAAPPTPPK